MCKFLLYFRKNFALFLQVRLLVNVMKVFRSLFLLLTHIDEEEAFIKKVASVVMKGSFQYFILSSKF